MHIITFEDDELRELVGYLKTKMPEVLNYALEKNLNFAEIAALTCACEKLVRKMEREGDLV